MPNLYLGYCNGKYFPWAFEKSIGQQKAKWSRLIAKAVMRGDKVEAQDRIRAYALYFII